MQRYTSIQSCSLLVEDLPLPSFSLLKKLSQVGIAAMKALKLLLEKGSIDVDDILIIDVNIVEVCLLEKMRTMSFIMVSWCLW